MIVSRSWRVVLPPLLRRAVAYLVLAAFVAAAAWCLVVWVVNLADFAIRPNLKAFVHVTLAFPVGLLCAVTASAINQVINE